MKFVKEIALGKFVVWAGDNFSQGTCDNYAERWNEYCKNDPRGKNHLSITFKPYTGLVGIKGRVQVGRVLTADTSAIRNLNGSIPSPFTYQWTRGNNVDVGTSPTYKLVPSDANHNIKVTVTYNYVAGDIREPKTTSATRGPVKAHQGSGKRKANESTPSQVSNKKSKQEGVSSNLKQKSFLKANQV